MNTTSVDAYLADGCGRCDLYQTPSCKVLRWTDILVALRALVNTTGLREEMKWGCPCYTLDGANVLMVSALKEAACLSFFKGTLLTDPAGILESPGPNSQAYRLITFTSLAELDARREATIALVTQAIALERAGAKVTFAKAPEPVPAELQALLDADPALAAAFAARPPAEPRDPRLRREDDGGADLPRWQVRREDPRRKGLPGPVGGGLPSWRSVASQVGALYTLPMLILVACDTPKPSDAHETGGAADTVLVTWTGFVDAVTRTPLGLDEASVAAEVSGSLRYDPSVADTAPDDVARGQYPLAGTSFDLELAGLGVVGSGSAEVEVTYAEGGDHLFGFRDGDSVHEDPPTMSVDGVERPDLGVYFVVEVRDHDSDALPDPFPDAGTATLLVVDDGGSLNLWLSQVE